MPDTIVREIEGSKGRYVIRRDGEEAELTCSIASPHLVVADHIVVPDSFHGSGPGSALVTHLVEDARAEGVRIMPLRPVVSALRKVPGNGPTSSPFEAGRARSKVSAMQWPEFRRGSEVRHQSARKLASLRYQFDAV